MTHFSGCGVSALHGVVDLPRALEGGAAVDQHRPGRRDDQSEVGVQALVLRRAWALVADMRIHAFGHALEAQVHGPGRQTRQ